MPASQASTETRIPRQIQRAADRAVARVPAEPDASRPAAVTDPATPPAATPATPAEPAADPRHSDPAYWKARFEVTSGMLAAERKVEGRGGSGDSAESQAYQTQTRTLQAAAPAAPIDLADFYTPEEIEKYGPEQCEAMARSALRAAKKTVDERIAAEVQPLREQQERRPRKTQKLRLRACSWTTAMSRLPDFDDTDARWHTWLNEIDPNTEAPRQAVLTIHSSSRNVAGCVKVIKAWQASLKTPTPPITPSGTQVQRQGGGCSDAVSRGRERARRADRCGSQGLLQTRSSRQGERRGTDCLRGSNGEAAKASCCCIDSSHAGATPILSGEQK